MNKFNVYLNSGKCIKIEADDYSLDYNKRSVKFEKGNLNIATFNFDNIQGFVMLEEGRL